MPFLRSVLIVLLWAAAVFPGSSLSQQTHVIVLAGGRVYPTPDGIPIDDALLVLDGTRIKSVGPRAAMAPPEGATIIDCSGLVIVAGFYNAHVHFTDMSRWEDAASQPAVRLTDQLREMVTRYGYTSVVDTASDVANTAALRRRIVAGEVAGPRILTAGSALYPPSGVPFYVREMESAAVVSRLPQPSTAQAARAVVSAQLDRGTEIVKLFTGSWVERGKVLPMPAEIAKAAAEQAHARRSVVFAHASNLAGLEVALDAHVDVLAHAIDDTRGVTAAHYARMKAQNMAIVPTLSLFRGRWSWDILDGVRSYARLGGETRGRIVSGLEADLVVLGADPAHGTRALADVRLVFRAGKVIYTRP